MKVAISIPDSILGKQSAYRGGCGYAQSTYARALEAYISAYSGEEITKRVKQVSTRVSSKVDPAAGAAPLSKSCAARGGSPPRRELADGFRLGP